MTPLVGPVCFMLAALAVLLWAAGVIPGPVATRIVVGAAAFLLSYAGVAGIVAIVRKRRLQREMARRGAALAATIPPTHILCIAGGPIAKGDLVRFDPATNTVKRVETLSYPPEPPSVGGIQ